MTPNSDELGAHVSSAGGVARAPDRAHDIESVCLQLFTKQPSRWAEPEIPAEEVQSFRHNSQERGIRFANSHDSYLINLATPDSRLWSRSIECFAGELRRSTALGLDAIVTHPGNATDGEIEKGLGRNAEGITRALEECQGEVLILLEITAGSGTSVGATFEHLATIIDGIPSTYQGLMGVCFDTCHAYAAGYDLVNEFDGVWEEFDRVLGLEKLKMFHLNDSKHPLGSRKDRHEHLGAGTLGEAPFRRIVTDERFKHIPKLLETPKEDDPVTHDLHNLRLLRSFRSP